ncbi:VPLPA-CTERM sorting domain-containing protein [Lichenifustis flavocetrariae]|uniref:VPLPA-CTERM sorting domain-containing protein n=1 Tax=Lichenifustis flavocetrariae TaxID=2949735 RepID=A0AA41YTY6_9HYPH|nr:VPLPA-CTERM sorting domain-containing protein [Lichenifustis flavocetrariae]MCW6506982.1 VPLPA-CTERM sorting domain-containing protein [Lichenifustis flavocetrariae]
MKKAVLGAAVAAVMACGLMVTTQANATSYRAELDFSGSSEINEPGYDTFGPPFAYTYYFNFMGDPLNFSATNSYGDSIVRIGSNVYPQDQAGLYLWYGEIDGNKQIGVGTSNYYVVGGNIDYESYTYYNYSDGQEETGYAAPQVFYSNATLTISQVPLPASAPLFGSALLTLGCLAYARRRGKVVTPQA